MSLHRQSLTQAKRIGDRVSQPSPGEGEAVKAAVKGPESHYHLPPTVATAEGPQGSRPVTGSEQDTNNAYCPAPHPETSIPRAHPNQRGQY